MKPAVQLRQRYVRLNPRLYGGGEAMFLSAPFSYPFEVELIANLRVWIELLIQRHSCII